MPTSWILAISLIALACSLYAGFRFGTRKRMRSWRRVFLEVFIDGSKRRSMTFGPYKDLATLKQSEGRIRAWFKNQGIFGDRLSYSHRWQDSFQGTPELAARQILCTLESMTFCAVTPTLPDHSSLCIPPRSR